MRIQLASDLHLEFLSQSFPDLRLIEIAKDIDVLVLAGDISNGITAIDKFKDYPCHIVYVAGNHEFYKYHMEKTYALFKEESLKYDNFHFLEKDELILDGVRFLGATLWTDYRLNADLSQKYQMDYAQQCLNDHRLIRTNLGVFKPQQALEEHISTVNWLQSKFKEPFNGKTVVVSHHGPHPNSTHPKYENSNLNSAFVSDLSRLLPNVDLWLHGHVHDGVDYQVGRCRVVANPVGYIQNKWVNDPDKFNFENEIFNKQKLIDL